MPRELSEEDVAAIVRCLDISTKRIAELSETVCVLLEAVSELLAYRIGDNTGIDPEQIMADIRDRFPNEDEADTRADELDAWRIP